MRIITKDQLIERGRAGAVFLGIALGTVAGFEMIIGAGFDPITPEIMFAKPRGQAQPPRARIYDATPARPYTGARYAAPAPSHETELPLQTLEGGADVQAFEIGQSIDEAELRREIDRLYAEGGTAYAQEYSLQDSDVAAYTAQNWR